ncbi:hypothetical protein FACS189425_10960 [Clostridia bacterium]|nr:hypothetical protein FACS189425_10960 [Clostridia bacterium]
MFLVVLALAAIRAPSGARGFKSEGEKLDFSLDCVDFEVDECSVTGARIEGLIRNNSGRMEILANISGVVSAPCARCLKDVLLPIGLEIEDVLSNDLQNLDAIYYSNNQVDLQEIVRETITLEIPMIITCETDCEDLLK